MYSLWFICLWFACSTLVIILAIWFEKIRKARITEIFQEIFFWLKEKSERIRYENHKNPRITAELKPEWQLDQVEVTTFIDKYEHYYDYYMLRASERFNLRILGVGEGKHFVSLAIKDKVPFDRSVLGSGFAEYVKSGDPVFDHWHIIRSKTPQAALKLLKDDKFRSYISNIHKLRIFKIEGDGTLSFTVECNYDPISAKNAILAMKRVLEVLSPKTKEKTAVSERVKPAVLKAEPQKIIDPELLLNLRKEFEKLSTHVSKLEFKPLEENFSRVIITPLLGEFDYVQYEIAEKLKVEAIDDLKKTVEKPITIEIRPKEVTLSLGQKIAFIEEIKTLFDIRCEDQEVLRRISEAYILFDSLSKIKELSIFSIKLQDSTLKICLECSVDPENIRKAYEAVKEAVNLVKFHLLI